MKHEEHDAEAQLRKRLEECLRGKPYRFNPDAGIVESVIRAMLKRREKYGEDYCPCRLVSGDKEKDAKIICPCVYHEAELEKDGFCHCRLFAK